MNKLGKIISEGKTKIIYSHTSDLSLAFMKFKSDITAGDGVKHDIIEGKDIIDFETNKNIFLYLNKKGLDTAFLTYTGGYTVVRRLDMLPLEVVSRRIATGSLLKRSPFKQGTYFDPLTMEFFYKDDSKHDPLMNDSLLRALGYRQEDLDIMRNVNERVFLLLENAFRSQDFQLIDFKLEYGKQDGRIYLGDEITAASMRVWPFRNEGVYPISSHTPEQIMDEVLDKSRQLDKQIYREGGTEEQVMTGFEKIKDITSRF